MARSAFTGAFLGCCKTTRVHFMACVAPEGKDCMGCQADFDGRPGPPFELCQSGSLTDGTALPFLFECLL